LTGVESLLSFDSNRLSHAYITDDSFSDTLATAVVCSTRNGKRPCLTCPDCSKASRHIHPDIIIVDRLDNKQIISVDQIRALKKDVYIVPNDSIQKAYIVRHSDSMNTNAQNAFLQILEEPPAHAVFILCTDNAAALLPTVRSRCVELKSQTADGQADDSGLEVLEGLVSDFTEALSESNVKLVECMFRLDKLDRLDFSDFLTLARERIVSQLRECISSGLSDKSKALIQAETTLLKAEEMYSLNVSTGHIAGYICANMVK